MRPFRANRLERGQQRCDPPLKPGRRIMSRAVTLRNPFLQRRTTLFERYWRVTRLLVDYQTCRFGRIPSIIKDLLLARFGKLHRFRDIGGCWPTNCDSGCGSLRVIHFLDWEAWDENLHEKYLGPLGLPESYSSHAALKGT